MLTLLMSLVRTPEARPNSVSLARFTTPSRSPPPNLETTMTGPKDSSLAMNIQSSTSAKIVGSMYKPGKDSPITHRQDLGELDISHGHMVVGDQRMLTMLLPESLWTLETSIEDRMHN